MRVLPLLIFIMTVSWGDAHAAPRESVTTGVAKVQALLRSIQEKPEIKQDLARTLRQTVSISQKQLVRDQLQIVIKPGRLPGSDPQRFIINGERFVLPKIEGQRSCDAIQEDWRDLDRVYSMVNDLALELDEVFSTKEFCALCVDTLLTTLREATEELESISSRLNADGERMVLVVWGPEAFLENRQDVFTTLNWDKLIYFNIDGDSRIGDATHPLPPHPGLYVHSPILQKGIQFQTDTTAERACSPGFEIRLDGLAKGMLPFERREPIKDLTRPRLRSVTVNLSLLYP